MNLRREPEQALLIVAQQTHGVALHFARRRLTHLLDDLVQLRESFVPIVVVLLLLLLLIMMMLLVDELRLLLIRKCPSFFPRRDMDVMFLGLSFHARRGGRVCAVHTRALQQGHGDEMILVHHGMRGLEMRQGMSLLL